jgi:hypothetical protein
MVKEVPPEVVEHEGNELKLLGFVGTKVDYLEITFALLEAQLAGYYEPEDGTMYMAGDLDATNAEGTLAHELDHALQDQHFDLKSHAKYEPGKADEQSAFSALAEGDATSTMADVLLASKGLSALDMPEEAFTEGMMDSVVAGSGKDVPHVMKTALVAPYTYGTIFVNALRRNDGGWPAVDQAWAKLPTTSEQILHVAKWRAHEGALDVKAPTFAALGAGWTKVDEDTNGELGMRLAYEEWSSADEAARAAAGWGGDRMVLAKNGDRSALAMRLRYDADSESRAASAFALVAKAIAGGANGAKGAAWACAERAETGPIGVMRTGRDLVFVAGPAKTGPAWASAGDCALAKKWADEIGKR